MASDFDRSVDALAGFLKSAHVKAAMADPAQKALHDGYAVIAMDLLKGIPGFSKRNLLAAAKRWQPANAGLGQIMALAGASRAPATKAGKPAKSGKAKADPLSAEERTALAQRHGQGTPAYQAAAKAARAAKGAGPATGAGNG
jgi:hypothetical protein